MKGFRRHLGSLLVAGAVLLLVSGCEQEPVTQKSAITDHQGNTLSQVAEDDSWLVVNYWATWCDPCRDEIPELNALHQDTNNNIRVWGVDFDSPSSVEELGEKVKQLEIGFPVVAPDKVALLGLERPPVLPATYLLNRQGEMKKRLIGPQTKESLQDAVAQQKGVEVMSQNGTAL